MSNKIFTIPSAKKKEYEGNKPTFKDVSMKSDHAYGEGAGFRIKASNDVDAVKNSMNNLFMFIPGERVLNPEYGNKLLKQLYEGINFHTEEQIVAIINEMVSTYEPRAAIDKIINVSTVDDTENNQFTLKIVWHVNGLPNEKYTIITGV